MNLIDIERAKVNIQGITDNTHDTALGVLIAACSDAVVKYCRREFALRFYDEVYSGDGQRRLLLRQYPVQSIESVRYRPVTVLKITNTDPANVQARVAVTSTGLTLVRVNAGVRHTDTSVTFVSNPTLAACVSAINLLGNGWSAQVVGDSTNYGSWPSQDLYILPSYGDGTHSQGFLSTVVGSGSGSFAELKMHTYELQGFQWDARGWLLRAIPYTDPELLHPEDLVFPVGINNLRIQYTAGYTVIPDSVQEACARLVAYYYYLTTRDPTLAHQVPDANTGGPTQGWISLLYQQKGLPNDVKALLLPYRRHTIATNQG